MFRQAVKFLRGKKVEKDRHARHDEGDKENAAQILKDNGL